MKTLKHHAERAFIEFLREQGGMGQEEFSNFCGFSVSWYSQFVNGKRNGSPLTFRKIAEAHKISYKSFKEQAANYYGSLKRPPPDLMNEALTVAEMLAQILSKLGVIERDIHLLKQKAGASVDRRRIMGIGPNGIERRSGYDRRGRHLMESGSGA